MLIIGVVFGESGYFLIDKAIKCTGGALCTFIYFMFFAAGYHRTNMVTLDEFAGCARACLDLATSDSTAYLVQKLFSYFIKSVFLS